MADNKVTKLVPPLASQDFALLQQVSLDFNVVPRAGVTVSDILNPGYWIAVANQLKPGCEVRVIPEDNSWYAKLLVLKTQRQNDLENQPAIGTYMALISFSDFTMRSKISEDDYEIRKTNNDRNYGVFRKSDGQVVRGGLLNEKQAKDYIEDLVRSAA